MFRSARRSVVFPQAEHARLAGALALAWRRDEVPVPFESFVTGVTLHDRGYEALDAYGIGEVPRGRWLEIQRRGFAPRGDDPVVDLMVALHVRRLVGEPRDDVFEAALPALYAAAHLDEETAACADRITHLCDRVAFDFCVEEPAVGAVGEVSYVVDGQGGITLDPWPLEPSGLGGLILAYAADGYPERLEPIVVPFDVRPV